MVIVAAAKVSAKNKMYLYLPVQIQDILLQKQLHCG